MRRQHGFALLELTIAVLIATLLAVWATGALVNKINDASAQASAVWMLSIKKATHSYIEQNAESLLVASDAGALVGVGYADWAAPTLAELKTGGFLSKGFPEQTAHGVTVGIRLMRTGVCPGSLCRIEALVYTNQALALYASGQVNEQLVAQWLMAAQGWGGAVLGVQPHLVTGAAFQFPNPPTAQIDALPVGAVAMAITAEQLTGLNFLRVRDGRDPQFQSAATVSGDINALASLWVQNYVFIGAQEQPYTSCFPNGLVARDYSGGLLVCRSYQWFSAGGSGGGGFSVNSATGCSPQTLNPVTGLCECPNGYEMVRISDSGPPVGAEGRTRGYLCVG